MEGRERSKGGSRGRDSMGLSFRAEEFCKIYLQLHS